MTKTNVAAPYNIASINGTVGSLHIHQSRDSNPRQIHMNAHAQTPISSTLIRSMNSLYSLSKPTKTSTPHVTIHKISSNNTTTSMASTPTVQQGYKRNGTPEVLTSITSSNSGNLLIAGSASGRIYVWYIPSGQLLKAFEDYSSKSSITLIKCLDDDSSLLICNSDSSFKLYNLTDILSSSPMSNNKKHYNFIGHVLPIISLGTGFAGVNSKLVSISMDKSIRVWHTCSFTCLHTFMFSNYHSFPKLLVLNSVTEAFFFVSLSNGSVLKIPLANLRSNSITFINNQNIHQFLFIHSISSNNTNIKISSMTLSPDNNELVIGYSDGIIRIYDTQFASSIHTYTKHAAKSPITFLTTFPSSSTSSDTHNDIFIPKTLSKDPLDFSISNNKNKNSKNINHNHSHFDSIHIPLNMSNCNSFQQISSNFINQALDVTFDLSTSLLQYPERSNNDRGLKKIKTIGENPQQMEVELEIANGSKHESHEDVEKLIEEVTLLRQRNKQLEQAGSQLLQLVKRQVKD